MNKLLLKRAELYPKLINDTLDAWPDLKEVYRLFSQYKKDTNQKFDFDIFLAFLEETIINYEN